MVENTLTQKEINTIFNKILERIPSNKQNRITRNENQLEVYRRIGRENVSIYARKKIRCTGFDQSWELEMRVSSMCSAVTLTKRHISEIDENIRKAVNLFLLSIREARQTELKRTADTRLQKKLAKQLGTTKKKYDTFIKTKIGKVKGWIGVENGLVNIHISNITLDQANEYIKLIA